MFQTSYQPIHITEMKVPLRRQAGYFGRYVKRAEEPCARVLAGNKASSLSLSAECSQHRVLSREEFLEYRSFEIAEILHIFLPKG